MHFLFHFQIWNKILRKWRDQTLSHLLISIWFLTAKESFPHSQPFLAVIAGPEVGKRTCLRHHCRHSLWLHLPEPPPTCLLLLRFMWLYRVGANPVRQAMWRPSFYTDSCLYDTIVGSKSGFGPVYLRSVISESLKRLRQFREDKWWTGRTADVGTQTLQDDGVD